MIAVTILSNQFNHVTIDCIKYCNKFNHVMIHCIKYCNQFNHVMIDCIKRLDRLTWLKSSSCIRYSCFRNCCYYFCSTWKIHLYITSPHYVLMFCQYTIYVFLIKGIGRPAMYKKEHWQMQAVYQKRCADRRVALGTKLPYLFVRIQQVH